MNGDSSEDKQATRANEFARADFETALHSCISVPFGEASFHECSRRTTISDGFSVAKCLIKWQSRACVHRERARKDRSQHDVDREARRSDRRIPFVFSKVIASGPRISDDGHNLCRTQVRCYERVVCSGGAVAHCAATASNAAGR